MKRRTSACLRWLLIGLFSTIFGYGVWQANARPVANFAIEQTPFLQTPSNVAGRSQPYFASYFASNSLHRYVHSASIAPLSDGGLIAAWFAGSREGAYDVNIYGARFDSQSGHWGEEFTLISREATERILKRNIRKLGNPVIALAPNDRLWLFYVSVSLGGWAGSAINVMYSDNGGKIWSEPRRLITSPFLNISTLVRNPPVFHSDGTIGLPIYHEFLGKFAEYLYMDQEGRIIDKFRISRGDHSLQPSIVPLDEDSAVALLRNAGVAHNKLLASFSHDSGQTWSHHVPVNPWNPNSSVAAINEGDGDLLVALNDLRAGRFQLTLFHTDSSLQEWRPVTVLDESPTGQEWVDRPAFFSSLEPKYMSTALAEEETPAQIKQLQKVLQERACKPEQGCGYKYEYPTLIRAPDGLFHLVYSWNNTLIKHVVFNRAWLEKRS